MHFYRIHDSGFQVLDQDDAANPAIPPLFAPAKQSAFQTHGAGRNHGDNRLANDEPPFFPFRPSDAEIRARPDLDPNAGSNEADILRVDESPYPIQDGPFCGKTATLDSPSRYGVCFLKGDRIRLP
jgi:hypothetical protein